MVDPDSPSRHPHGGAATPAPAACPPGWSIGPPDFVGVGVQRGGTSWWWRQLTVHPGVHVPPLPLREQKERHLFDFGYRDEVAERRVREYAAHFPRPPGTITGEWTPRYIYDEWTPRLLARAAPAARIVVMLRDPVDRFGSALAMLLRRARKQSDLKPAALNEAVGRGLYAGQLHLLLDHFDASRVLILQYERCLRDPGPELERTWRFLGLDPSRGVAPAAEVGFADRPRPAISDEVRRDLVARYEPDVRSLGRDHPEIDLSLWSNFTSRRERTGSRAARTGPRPDATGSGPDR